MCRWLLCRLCCLVVLLGWAVACCHAAEPRKTENVILVMIDGFRWHEVFNGADASLFTGSQKPVTEALQKRFCREKPEDSRKAVMPFLWSVIAEEGQIYGNQNKQSKAQVTNGLKFSYPGFSETLCGYHDPRIESNTPGPNPNVTVLEWLHRRPGFDGRVAGFGTWSRFNHIIHHERCGFCVNAGCDPLAGIHTPEVNLLNVLKREVPRVYDGGHEVVLCDALMFHTALQYMKAKRPRVLFLALCETDEWGHAGNYGEYLISAQRADQYVKTLWETAQTIPEYAGKTSIIFSTDHGRGVGPEKWKTHTRTEHAEDIWMAFLGPDTPALGERVNVSMVTQNQIAGTLASLLGEGYCVDVPKAGKPIADVLGPVK